MDAVRVGLRVPSRTSTSVWAWGGADRPGPIEGSTSGAAEGRRGRRPDRVGEVARRGGVGHDRVGQAHPEGLLEAQEQLDALEAPDAEVPVEDVKACDRLSWRPSSSSARRRSTTSSTRRSTRSRPVGSACVRRM